jgi:hypothetical protein
MTDTGSRLIIVTGDQEGTDLSPFVLRAGDEMTGGLTVPGILSLQGSEFQAGLTLHRLRDSQVWLDTINVGLPNPYAAAVLTQARDDFAPMLVGSHAHPAAAVRRDEIASLAGAGAAPSVMSLPTYVPGPAGKSADWGVWHIPTGVSWTWCGTWDQWATHPDQGAVGILEVCVAASARSDGCNTRLGIATYPGLESAWLDYLELGRAQRPALDGGGDSLRTQRMSIRATGRYMYNVGAHPILVAPMVAVTAPYEAADTAAAVMELTGIRVSWRWTPGLVWGAVGGRTAAQPRGTAPADGSPATGPVDPAVLAAVAPPEEPE